MNRKSLIINLIIIALCLVFIGVGVYVLMRSNDRNQGSTGTDQPGTGTGTGTSYGYNTLNLAINEVSGEGWIELYNPGKQNKKLEGYKIIFRDKVVYSFKEDDVLKPGQFLTVELGGKPDDGNAGIRVQDENGRTVISVSCPQLAANESYGAVTDGGKVNAYITTTKGASNASATQIKKDFVYFSALPGFHSASFNLKIFAPEGCTVYYTLDSSEPTTASDKYEQDITITFASGSQYKYANQGDGKYTGQSLDMGTVVRAIAVDAAGTVVDESTAVYYIGIGTDSEYANIPIVSIVTSPDNLFDYYTGIYLKGKDYEDALISGKGTAGRGNYYLGLSKPAVLHYFEPDKMASFSSSVELSIIPNSDATGAQKPMKLTGIENVGSSSLAKYVDAADSSLSITNYASDYIYKTRSQFAYSIYADGAAAGREVTPCAVFVDGEYWGVYQLRRPVDTHYLSEKFDVDDAFVIENGKDMDDEVADELYDLIEYVTMNDLSRDDKYAALCNMLDVENYAEYICINMYLANAGYSTDGYAIWKSKVNNGSGYNDGKWRFMCGDMVLIAGSGFSNGLSTATIDTFKHPGITNDVILRALIVNDSFKALIRATMERIIADTFSEDKVTAAVDQVGALMRKPAIASYSRYGGATNDDYFKKELKTIPEFFEKRTDYIMTHMEEFLKCEWLMEE